jgi:hypothetical protein
MIGISHRRRIRRHHILWGVLALLWLCQQAAFAASACIVSMPTTVMSMAHAKRLMCAEHCAQGTAIQSDASLPHVPGSLLPPLAPDAPVVAMLPRAEASFAWAAQGHADRPPLRLLFCSLLI